VWVQLKYEELQMIKQELRQLENWVQLKQLQHKMQQQMILSENGSVVLMLKIAA
jgi:hypothetical protein